MKGNVLLGKLSQSVKGGRISRLNNASYIFPNGTFLIYKVKEADAGQYTVVGFTASGAQIYKGNFLLEIQVAPDVTSSVLPVTLGRPVTLSLPIPSPELAGEMVWKKGNVLLGKVSRFVSRNGTPEPASAYYIFPNGTFLIYEVKEGDAGQYTVDGFNESGLHIFTRKFLLVMQGQKALPTFSHLILTMVVITFTVSVFLASIICAMRKKKNSEPVLEVVIYEDRRDMTPLVKEPVATEEAFSKDSGAGSSGPADAEDTDCPDEDLVSTRSRESSASFVAYDEQDEPLNVSTFQPFAVVRLTPPQEREVKPEV